MSETIKFETNIPQVIALAFSEGKPVESQFTGSQMMFSTVDGRRLYLAPFVAEKIKAAGIQARQPFELCRRQSGKSVEWQIRTQNAATDSLKAPVAALVSVDSANRTPSPYRDQALDATYRALAQPAVGLIQFADHTARPTPQQPKREMSDMCRRILGSYVVALEVVAALEEVIDERGLALNFTREEHIRAIAATAFIEANKAGR